MEIFKTKIFDKWAKDVSITDQSLIEVATEIENGLINADLGGNLIKQRIANKGRGKRGGSRVIVAYAIHKQVFFIHGFEKSKHDNITKKELDSLKKLGATLLTMPKSIINRLLKHEELLALKEEKYE